MKIEWVDRFHFLEKDRKQLTIAALCDKMKSGQISQEELTIVAKIMEMVATHEVMDRAVFSDNFYVDLNKKEHREAFI